MAGLVAKLNAVLVVPEFNLTELSVVKVFGCDAAKAFICAKGGLLAGCGVFPVWSNRACQALG